MPSLWALLFFAFITFSSSTQQNNNVANRYIVRVRNDMKPSTYSDVEQWYHSTLTSLDPTSLDSPRTRLGHVYKTVFHGFSAELTPQQAEEIKARPEVLAVYPNRLLQLHTTRSSQFLGLIDTSNAPTPSGLLKASDYGSNVTIGVLDTGVWPERESYNDDGIGPVPSHWKGECAQDQNFTKSNCNKKLVGARFYGGTPGESFLSARDSEGHGTHTSSTAAGSKVSNASLFEYAPGTATGVASKARIAAYKICWPNGCTSEDIVAAYDQAVQDGVDIISYSVGGDTLDYSDDPIVIAQFGALENNVFVSASAGNDGPSAGSVTNIPPWITTVGASTIDRSFPADLKLADGSVLSGVSLYSGPALSAKVDIPLVFVEESSICAPGSLDPKQVRGKIVVCERGAISRAVKGEVVKNASGVGMVLVNTAKDGEDLVADAHIVPAVALSYSVAEKLFSYMQRSKNPRATILFRGTKLNIVPAPVVAGFSSRGPNIISDFIIKPDLIAPGVDILAAWPDNVAPSSVPSDKRQTKFNIISGTSMSCPHISGVAALLKGAHPDWSPSRIKSALLTTSYVVDSHGKPLLDEVTNKSSDTWGYGSGHVDPEKAADPGLVYDLTVDDYIDFLCASNYSESLIHVIAKTTVRCKKGLKPWNLNYPSIAVAFKPSNALKYEVEVNRTVTHVGEGASSYTVKVENPPDTVVTVDPPKLEFSKKEEKLSYVVKISAKKFDTSNTVFGRITWQDGKHSVSSPIAVIVEA